MALEDLTGPAKFIDALVTGNPVSDDDRREGDDHIRGIKNVLRNQFPNLNAAVTLTDEQINAIPANLGLALQKAANLGDVQSAFNSRVNLGVHDASNRWAVTNSAGPGLLLAPTNGSIPLRVNFFSAPAGFAQWDVAGTTRGYIGVDGGGIAGGGTGAHFGMRAEGELMLMGGGNDRFRLATDGMPYWRDVGGALLNVANPGFFKV